MSFLICNIVWLIFGGLPAAIVYFIVGIILCSLIVTIPWGVEAIKLGFTVLTPFRRRLVQHKRPTSCFSLLENFIWIVCAGWILSLMHLLLGLVLSLTVIGIPFGLYHLRFALVVLDPFSNELKSFPEKSLSEIIADRDEHSNLEGQPTLPRQEVELHQRESRLSLGGVTRGGVTRIRDLLSQPRKAAEQSLVLMKEKRKEKKQTRTP